MSAQPLPVCYRHHDRETRLACGNCGRPVCVDCVRFAQEGQRCPECSSEPADTASAGSTGLSDTRREGSSPFTFAVLAVALLAFAISLFSPQLWLEVFAAGAQFNEAVAQGELWRVVTASFLHADLTHVLFNMWALYLFGPPLERESGSVPFALLYLASVLAGGAAFYLFAPGGTAIGASGAIFGLFGAWLVAALRNRGDPRGRDGLRQMLVLLAINIALPLFIPRIAWQAHLGGFLAGFLIAVLWLAASRRGASTAMRALIAAAVGAAAFASLLL